MGVDRTNTMNLKRAVFLANMNQAREQGMKAGIEEGKKQALRDLNNTKLAAQIKLIEASAAFQEGVTKLIMAIEHQL